MVKTVIQCEKNKISFTLYSSISLFTYSKFQCLSFFVNPSSSYRLFKFARSFLSLVHYLLSLSSFLSFLRLFLLLSLPSLFCASSLPLPPSLSPLPPPFVHPCLPSSYSLLLLSCFMSSFIRSFVRSFVRSSLLSPFLPFVPVFFLVLKDTSWPRNVHSQNN